MMALKLGTVVFGVYDVDRAVAFWSAAMGFTPHRFESSNDFTILVPPGGQGTRIALQRSDTEPTKHARVHIDLIVEDVAEQQAEVARLIALGARVLDWDSYPEDPDFLVMADPDDNQFCIVNAGHGSP